MFLNDICLGKKFQNTVHKVEIYFRKTIKINIDSWKHYRQ